MSLFCCIYVEIKKKHLDNLYMVMFFGIIAIIVVMNTTSILPYDLVVIDNTDPNSMWPTYSQGDIFIVKNGGPDSFKIGDILVYRNKHQDLNVIHRIIDIQIIEGKYYYRVKGDNPLTNKTPDNLTSSTLIPYEDVMGIIVKRIPQIGHLSLAIQGNPVIRIFTLMIAAGLAIGILAWPDKKEENDEDEVVEITGETLKAEISKRISPFIKFFKVDRPKLLIRLALIFVTIILLLSPLFVGGIVNINGDEDCTCIYNASFDNPIFYNEGNQSYLFIQARIHLNDTGGFFNSLNHFDIIVSTQNNPENQISHTTWKTLRDIRGSVMMGIAIVIYESNIPINGTTLLVSIPYDVQGFFSNTSGEYTTSFILNYTK